jgi:hypothetical protein
MGLKGAEAWRKGKACNKSNILNGDGECGGRDSGGDGGRYLKRTLRRGRRRRQDGQSLARYDSLLLSLSSLLDAGR